MIRNSIFVEPGAEDVQGVIPAGFWVGIQALRFLDPGWKHAGVTEFETFAEAIHLPSGHPEAMKRTEPNGQLAARNS